MSKLNPVAQKWVEALRNGEYKQGTGCLKARDQFCCLGVLSDLAVKHGIGRWDGLERFTDGSEERSGRLARSVMQWAKVKDSEGAIDSPPSRLTMLNDNGATFLEIADLIEQHADELFVPEVTA